VRPYRPRRQSKRWLDGDCPSGVLAIYDNKGKTADRYTVFYAQTFDYSKILNDWPDPTIWIGGRFMSEAPSHPQGVGMYVEMKAHEVSSFRYRNRHRACKWSDLPDKVKECVRQDLADYC